MTHPTLKAMVEAAKRIEDPSKSVNREYALAQMAFAAQPANILSLAEYVRGLEEKAAAVLKEVTYLSGKYPLEPSLFELEVAADDLRAALGGKP